MLCEHVATGQPREFLGPEVRSLACLASSLRLAALHLPSPHLPMKRSSCRGRSPVTDRTASIAEQREVAPAAHPWLEGQDVHCALTACSQYTASPPPHSSPFITIHHHSSRSAGTMSWVTGRVTPKRCITMWPWSVHGCRPCLSES